MGNQCWQLGVSFLVADSFRFKAFSLLVCCPGSTGCPKEEHDQAKYCCFFSSPGWVCD